MKKNLLFAALLVSAMSANAQTEICFTDTESAGLASEKATFAGGTVVGTSDNVTMTLAYEDSWGATDITFQGYNGATVNGTEVSFTRGITGNTNPGGVAVGAEGCTAATNGAVVQFDVKKDGYLAVFCKISSNKNYYVWEGLAGKGESAVAYTLAMDWSAAGLADHPSIVYTMPADADGYVNFASEDIDTYVNGTQYRWPEKVILGQDAENVAKNGVGAIIFPVYAEAESYLVHAQGSKISTCGAVFTTEPITSLTLTGENTLDLIGGNPNAISSVNADANGAAAMYNMAGQRVNNSFKGLTIMNGKKFINK